MHKGNPKKKIDFFYQRMSDESLKQSRLSRSKTILSAWMLNLVFIGLVFLWSFLNPDLAFSGGKGAKKEFRLGIRDKIFASYQVENNTCWAVGNFGLIIKTADSGKTWQRQDIITTLALFDIFFVNNNKGWIVGDIGLILNTEDGGSSWKKQSSSINSPLMKIFFLDEHRGFAVGGEGKILYTENGGKLWQVYQVDWLSVLPEEVLEKGVFAPCLYDVFFADAAHGWIVGDGGIVLKTSDGGKQWELLSSGFSNPLFSIFFKTESEGWACGNMGFLIHTRDGGKSWVELKTPEKCNLFKIRMYGDTFGLIVGERGTVLQTDDGGLTWSLHKLNLESPLPYFSEVCVVGNSSPMKIILLGERIVETSIQKIPNQ